MPKISLLVVIKGPVAIAGSIPLLSKKRGINVPLFKTLMKNDANILTLFLLMIQIKIIMIVFIDFFSKNTKLLLGI